MFALRVRQPRKAELSGFSETRGARPAKWQKLPGWAAAGRGEGGRQSAPGRRPSHRHASPAPPHPHPPRPRTRSAPARYSLPGGLCSLVCLAWLTMYKAAPVAGGGQTAGRAPGQRSGCARGPAWGPPTSSPAEPNKARTSIEKISALIEICMIIAQLSLKPSF